VSSTYLCGHSDDFVREKKVLSMLLPVIWTLVLLKKALK
jgi:hypothetical protein